MSSPADGILVIKHGTLIDGTGSRPRLNGRIVISGGKVAEVGPDAPLDQAGGAMVIDAAGSFILPGLIDGHVHLSMYQRRRGSAFRTAPNSARCAQPRT